MEIYLERMKCEYGVEVETGKPRVNFRETITKRSKFDYIHKKQTGGQGQVRWRWWRGWLCDGARLCRLGRWGCASKASICGEGITMGWHKIG